MASETVDPIDWPLLPTLHRAVTPELHVLHGVNAGYKSHDLVQPLGHEHESFSMPDQRTACAATQGIVNLSYRNNVSIAGRQNMLENVFC